MIEFYKEEIPVTVTMADGTEDTSPVVHWGARLMDGDDVVHEFPAADNYGMTEGQVRQMATRYADSIGLATVPKEEMLDRIDEQISKIQAHAQSEVARLQSLRATVAKRKEGLTAAEAARLEGGG